MHAKPGQYLYGSAGNGSTPHLAAEMFKLATRTEMVHVPYKGSGPALVDLFAGSFSVYFPSLPAILPHVKSGKITALAVTGSRKSQLAPNLPLLGEAGVPGFSLEQWYGIFAPARTPDVVAEQLNEAFVRALRQPDLVARLSSSGFEVVGNTQSEFAAYIRDDVTRWARVVKAANIRID